LNTNADCSNPTNQPVKEGTGFSTFLKKLDKMKKIQ
jgi:hypothetical protein